MSSNRVVSLLGMSVIVTNSRNFVKKSGKCQENWWIFSNVRISRISYHVQALAYGMRLHVHASTHAWNIDMQKKAHLVWLKKLQGVDQITHLKQQRFLSFTFYKVQRFYEKMMHFVISLVGWWKLYCIYFFT